MTNIDIILVDEKDKIIGYQDKIKTHKIPVPLHRAISVVIYDNNGKRMLLHKRTTSKSTWPLFWTNACCSHPLKGESYKAAAERRLKEEMGFSTFLKQVFKFIYKAKYDEIWGEHELDTVFIGNYEGEIKPNPEEVDSYKWVEIGKLASDVKKNSGKYTPWFKIILEKLEKS